MSNDLQVLKMNPFETLPDDAMLHIFSFLPGKDLLTLSTVDRKFHRVITTSKETKDKTPMLINFNHKKLKLGDAFKAAQNRGFTALKLSGVSQYKSKTLLFNKVMKELSETVQDLVIESSNFGEGQFQSIIQMFLPKLKKCKLDEVKFSGNEEIVEVSSRSSSNHHPLKVLEIIETNDKVFDLFADCSGLKSFEYFDLDQSSESNQRLNDFLARQTRLEMLDCNYERLDLSRMNFGQLKVLKTSLEDNAKAAELGKLPSLKILEVTASSANLRRAMDSISSAPQLEDLRIQARGHVGQSPKHFHLEGILNHNVRKLTIYGQIEVTAQLLEVFSGVESIYLHRNTSDKSRTLNLSDVPLETIKKIKIMSRHLCVKLKPEQVPAHLEEFTSAVMYFARENYKRIEGITIGHENWRHHRNFSLPNLFCEDLVKCLRKLKDLKLFNVAHRENFAHFLVAYQRRLEFAKLVKPRLDGEPEPKKFKIEM